MIDLCAAHAIYPVVSVQPVSQLGHIYSRLDSCNDAGTRYVLDLAGSLHEGAFAACEAEGGAMTPALGPNETRLSYARVAREALRMLCREGATALCSTVPRRVVPAQ